MTLAYRIVNWKKIGEVTDKGRAAKEDTPDEKIRRTRPDYIRWKIQGHSLSPARRRLSRKAWLLGPMMDVACDGIYIRLLDLAGVWDDPELRGWILDDRKRPMNPYQVADLFEIKDTDHIKAVFDLLCDPDIGLLEQIEFPGAPATAGQAGGDLGESGRGGEEGEKLFLNETEAEEERSLNYVTESDSPGFPDTASQAPSPALVSDTVSKVPATVSDSAPGRGPGMKKKRVQAHFQLCKIIRPRDSSDQTTFRDIFDQLEQRMIYDTDEPLFEKALEKAKECCLVGKVPAAMFTEAMKQKPFCYIPVGRSTIRGKADKYRKD